MDYLETAIELIVGFIALFTLTKILGKTQITQITPFDFISAIVIGELVGNALYDDKVHVGKIVFSVVLWGALIYIVELITQKFKGTRKLLEGEPSIVIKKGRLERDILKQNKLDINQLQHLLRSKDVFSIREVEYAILETDGTVSVMKKPQFENTKKQDFNLPYQNIRLPTTLIIDGEIVEDNLKAIEKDQNWLLLQLKAFGASSIQEVFYAEWQEGEGLFVDKYHK